MSKADRMMAEAIDRIDRVLDKAVTTVRLHAADMLLTIASKVLAVNVRLFDRMVRYATAIIEAEEGAKI